MMFITIFTSTFTCAARPVGPRWRSAEERTPRIGRTRANAASGRGGKWW